MKSLLGSSTLPPSLLGLSKTRTNTCCVNLSHAKRRGISSTVSRHSYIGSTPIPVPQGITLERVLLKSGLDSSKTEAPSSRKNSGTEAEERLVIRGANGETSIKVYNFMRFLLPNAPPTPGREPPSGNADSGVPEFKVKRRNPPCPPTAIAHPFSFTPPSTPTPAAADVPQVTLFVENPTEKRQRTLWGLTRTLIANAIAGQNEGYTLPIYLIGVGYRAALEVDQASIEQASQTKTPNSTALTSPKSTVVSTPVGSTTTYETYPRRRLVMRLGYSHVIYVPVPADLRVTVPSPTIIIVWGRDRQRVSQFCADVRALRKPEVYKGKVCTFLAPIVPCLTS